jgi:hypothetical protein
MRRRDFVLYSHHAGKDGQDLLTADAEKHNCENHPLLFIRVTSSEDRSRHLIRKHEPGSTIAD